LQSAQISRPGFYRKRGTDLARSPRAGKTGNEAGEIRWFGYCAGKLAPIGEYHQMRLNRAYLFQELQRVQDAGHLAQSGFGGLRKTLCLQQPLTRRLWRMVSLGHLSAQAVLLRELEGGWKKFTNRREAPYSLVIACAAAMPWKRR
jgi:hypothetical protein